MATIKVVDIVKRAEDTLQSVNVRYPRLELQNWINDAYRQIVAMKPSANALFANATLAAGVRQNLHDAGSINLPSAIALLDVKRNVAATSDLGAIKPISGKTLDSLLPEWRSTTASVNIKYWMPDARTETYFDVYPSAPTAAAGPPVVAAAVVEILYSAVPSQHALAVGKLDPTDVANTDVISMDDIYANPIYEFVMFRALSKETDSPDQSRLAAMHFSAFTALMGAEK